MFEIRENKTVFFNGLELDYPETQVMFLVGLYYDKIGFIEFKEFEQWMVNNGKSESLDSFLEFKEVIYLPDYEAIKIKI